MRSARLLRTLMTVISSPRVIFLVALTMRIWVLAQLLPANASRDFYRYNEPSHIAWSVVTGAGYTSPWANTVPTPTAQQPPVYPYLLAGVFKLAGAYSYLSLLVAVGLNAVFSACTAVLILKIGRQTFGAATAVLAAWMWSCWIYEAVVSIRLWESSLSALLLALAIWMLPKVAHSPSLSLWTVFGVLGGLVALTNASVLSLFPFFWLWLWISYRRRGLSCNKWLVASVMTCIAVVAPWIVRNYVTFHRVIPIRDNFGLELFLGNHEGVNYILDDSFPPLNPTQYNRLGEIRFMEAKRDAALEFIGRHPAQFLRLSARRFFQFWTLPEGSAWPAMSLLAWMGAILALRRLGFDAIPLVLVVVVFPAAYYITHVISGYRHPIESLIFLLAAYGLFSAIRYPR